MVEWILGQGVSCVDCGSSEVLIQRIPIQFDKSIFQGLELRGINPFRRLEQK